MKSIIQEDLVRLKQKIHLLTVSNYYHIDNGSTISKEELMDHSICVVDELQDMKTIINKICAKIDL